MTTELDESFDFSDANNKIGAILAYTIAIEESISEIITYYFKPINPELFQETLMNSSIVGYGQKLKILANLENFDPKVLAKLRTIGSLRNAIAHNNLFITVQSHFKSTKNLKENIELKVMNSSGKLVSKKFQEIIDEFHLLEPEISASLEQYLQKLRNAADPRP